MAMTQQDAQSSAHGLAGKVLRLVDLVAYQDDSVVSRTVLDKQAGTVTLFAFDHGQGLSEHTTPYDALVYALDGQADVTISGERHRISVGDALIMPANEPHAVHAVERFKMALVMIRS